MKKRPPPPAFIMHEISQTCWHRLHSSFQLTCGAQRCTEVPRVPPDPGQSRRGAVTGSRGQSPLPHSRTGAARVKTVHRFLRRSPEQRAIMTPQAGPPLLLGRNIREPARHSTTGWSTDPSCRLTKDKVQMKIWGKEQFPTRPRKTNFSVS